ncbi:unnamed protein product [Amoebophrya sp. A120]|nr:unnamed protein product [Amoebophrya sp. A120]|eukprot:GSA120T00014108001.1
MAPGRRFNRNKNVVAAYTAAELLAKQLASPGRSGGGAATSASAAKVPVRPEKDPLTKTPGVMDPANVSDGDQPGCRETGKGNCERQQTESEDDKTGSENEQQQQADPAFPGWPVASAVAGFFQRTEHEQGRSSSGTTTTTTHQKKYNLRGTARKRAAAAAAAAASAEASHVDTPLGWSKDNAVDSASRKETHGKLEDDAFDSASRKMKKNNATTVPEPAVMPAPVQNAPSKLHLPGHNETAAGAAAAVALAPEQSKALHSSRNSTSVAEPTVPVVSSSAPQLHDEKLHSAEHDQGRDSSGTSSTSAASTTTAHQKKYNLRGAARMRRAAAAPAAGASADAAGHDAPSAPGEDDKLDSASRKNSATPVLKPAVVMPAPALSGAVHLSGRNNKTAAAGATTTFLPPPPEQREALHASRNSTSVAAPKVLPESSKKPEEDQLQSGHSNTSVAEPTIVSHASQTVREELAHSAGNSSSTTGAAAAPAGVVLSTPAEQVDKLHSGRNSTTIAAPAVVSVPGVDKLHSGGNSTTFAEPEASPVLLTPEQADKLLSGRQSMNVTAPFFVSDAQQKPVASHNRTSVAPLVSVAEKKQTTLSGHDSTLKVAAPAASAERELPPPPLIHNRTVPVPDAVRHKPKLRSDPTAFLEDKSDLVDADAHLQHEALQRIKFGKLETAATGGLASGAPGNRTHLANASPQENPTSYLEAHFGHWGPKKFFTRSGIPVQPGEKIVVHLRKPNTVAQEYGWNMLGHLFGWPDWVQPFQTIRIRATYIEGNEQTGQIHYRAEAGGETQMAPYANVEAPRFTYIHLRDHMKAQLARVLQDSDAFKRFVHNYNGVRKTDEAKRAETALWDLFYRQLLFGEIASENIGTGKREIRILKETTTPATDEYQHLGIPAVQGFEPRDNGASFTYNPRKVDGKGSFGQVYKSFTTSYTEGYQRQSVEQRGHHTDEFDQVMKVVTPKPNVPGATIKEIASEIVANFLLTHGTGYAKETKECVSRFVRVMVIEDTTTESESLGEAAQIVTFLEKVRMGDDGYPQEWDPPLYVSRFHQCLRIMEKAQVVMNDLKPANVGRDITNNNHVRFLDFGLATILSGKKYGVKSRTAILGTRPTQYRLNGVGAGGSPVFMSPLLRQYVLLERATGDLRLRDYVQDWYGPKADWFAASLTMLLELIPKAQNVDSVTDANNHLHSLIFCWRLWQWQWRQSEGVWAAVLVDWPHDGYQYMSPHPSPDPKKSRRMQQNVQIMHNSQFEVYPRPAKARSPPPVNQHDPKIRTWCPVYDFITGKVAAKGVVEQFVSGELKKLNLHQNDLQAIAQHITQAELPQNDQSLDFIKV